MNLLKDRTLELAIVEVVCDNNKEATGYNEIANVEFFAKSIGYDIKTTGVDFEGLKKMDTLQWYSSEIEFKISGDSYITPFKIPTLITDDKEIKSLYDLYHSKFHESNFKDIGKYKFRLTLSGQPVLPDDSYVGVITSFNFDESDDRIGLLNYNIVFLGKAAATESSSFAIDGFLKDLLLSF